MTIFALVLALAVAPAPADTQDVYRTLLLRAAPGALQQVIERWGARLPAFDAAGQARPVIMRHSQGDHWDLLLLFPIESLGAHFTAREGSRFGSDQAQFERELESLVAWREELFVSGPPHDTLAVRASDAGLFHIEMFRALPGRRAALARERRMEDDYLERTGRASNLLFERLAGASWDMFTVGFYRNMAHFAEDPPVSPEEAEAAARAAGFEGRGTIGFELRSLLDDHHDTLASAIR